MKSKLCTGCGERKALIDFHPRRASKDGLSYSCKECQRAYDKARASLPRRVSARTRYQQTEIGRAAANRAKKAYVERNPLKRAAHIAVGNALRLGKLSRQACERCGDKATEAHHDDYSKPLKVRWLCKMHHVEAHASEAA